MNTKINLQQLAKILAQKKGISQKDSESFLKEFFDSIVQNVTSDKLVKIKGLGTFKLIEVLDRESVNVNTGERIVIPGHSKLSFAPETALKDLINKPFGDFQTTIINEGTNIEEMEWVPQETTSLESSPEEEGVVEPEDEVVVEEEQAPQPPTEEEPVPAAEVPAQKFVDVPKDAAVEVPQETQVEAPEPEHVVEDESVVEDKKDEPKKPHSIGKIALWIACVLLLCLLGFFAYKYLSCRPSAQPKDESMEQVEAPQDSIAETPDEEVEYAQVPGGKYKIVGTKKTYVMKPGDFLTRIAIREYGDKDIAQYIIVHNDFPDPDNVPVDMEIKLPELEPVE